MNKKCALTSVHCTVQSGYHKTFNIILPSSTKRQFFMPVTFLYVRVILYCREVLKRETDT